MQPCACAGCGLRVQPAEGPTHAYIGSSPGCWALFNELMLGPLGKGTNGHLVGDAYAAQHPGVPERRAMQSVGVHLVLLCATLERDWPSKRAVWLRGRATSDPPEPWRWLDPALPIGTLTVAHPLTATDPDERLRLVREWAEDVWAAYRHHQELVRGWVDRLLA